MKISELTERIENGEDSFTQFKENIISAKDFAKELVAFSNSEGDIVIFGVKDSGEINGLDFTIAEQIGQLIGNVANENVKPPIVPLMQNFKVNGKRLVVVAVVKGVNRPYMTSSGEYYTKVGADKKKISQDELRRLFAESKRLYADEERVNGSSINDLDLNLFENFLQKDNLLIFEQYMGEKLNLSTILNNLDLMKEDDVTLAGNLLFGKNPQKFTPSFYIDCCYFNGNSIDVDSYISKKTLKGNFIKLFEDSLNFLKSHLASLQYGNNFNDQAKLEIDERVLIELIVNTLIHRDYYINSSIKIFMFHNRIEIINPGKLTNSLTVEKIKSGISIHRNPILNSISKTFLPYSGYGSGIKRVLLIEPKIEFINDTSKEEFKVIIKRKIDIDKIS